MLLTATRLKFFGRIPTLLIFRLCAVILCRVLVDTIGKMSLEVLKTFFGANLGIVYRKTHCFWHLVDIFVIRVSWTVE